MTHLVIAGKQELFELPEHIEKADTVSILRSVKELLQVLRFKKLDRGDNSPVHEDLKITLSGVVTKMFWRSRDDSEDTEDRNNNLQTRLHLIEILCLTAESTAVFGPRYMEEWATNMTLYFVDDVLGVQVPMLVMTAAILTHMTSPLDPKTLENIVRTVVKVLQQARKVLETELLRKLHILTQSIDLLRLIVEKSHICPEWEKAFKTYDVPVLAFGLIRFTINVIFILLSLGNDR
jgi:hypothetical protein